MHQFNTSSSTTGTDSVPEMEFEEDTDALMESEEYFSEESYDYVDSDNSELEHLYESFAFEDELVKDTPPQTKPVGALTLLLYSGVRLTAYHCISVRGPP